MKVMDYPSDLALDLNKTIEVNARDLDGSVVARFRRVMEQLPAGHLAYVDGNESLTYGELDALSDGVAALVATLLGRGDGGALSQPVALLLPHAAIGVVAILGTLKAGHFYVPLESSQSVSSLQQIVGDCTPRLLLTVGTLLDMAHEIIGLHKQTQVCSIEHLPRPSEAERAEVHLHGQAIVSIQYTSGSTGQPRGIVRTHAQNIKSAYNLCMDGGYCPSDRVAHLLSYAHGMTTLVIFGACLHGATLYAEVARDLSPKALYAWLQARQITQLTLSVGMIRALGELADSHSPLASMRMLSTGGEAINSSAIRRMQRMLPRTCAFVFRLGATEAGSYTGLVVPHELSWEGERVPTGYPLALMEVTIRDEGGAIVASPAIGEITVRSRYLAAGYWRQPEHTVAKFLPDPEGGDCRTFLTGDMGYFDADGMLVVLGRKDFMVKIRGYRVELEAVETALQALPSVQEAAVLAQEMPSGDKRLIAYVVARHLPNEAAATSATWRTQLAATVPEYMVPALFVPMAEFPRNIGGKIDRKALPLPENRRPTLNVVYVAPRTETEVQVGLIWEELLGINPIGAYDDFFSLGGNSLLAMRMALRVEQHWHKAVPTEFFLTPTLAFLSHIVDGTVMEPGDVSLQQFTPPVAVSPMPAAHAESIRVAGKRTLFVNPKLDVRRKVRYLPEQVTLQMTFDQGWRWLHRYCSQTQLMRVLYKHEYRRFVRMADDFAIPTHARSSAFRMHLVCNIISTLQKSEVQQPLTPKGLFTAADGWPRFFRTFAQHLATSKVGNAESFVRFTGMEIVEEAYRRGQGVILLSFHTPSLRYAMTPLVRHMGVDGITTLSGGRAERWYRTIGRELSIGTLPASSTAFVAEVTHRAMQILRQGGLLQIVNDFGYDKQGTLPFPIGGRTYLLKPGFAELSLETGATVIPYHSSWQEDGRMHTVFLPPMAETQRVPESIVERQEVVHSMVETYAKFVAGRLQKMPDAWTWAMTSHFLQQPLHK